MVVEDPAKPAEPCHDSNPGIVELHFGVWFRLDGEFQAVGDAEAAFCELDAFEHGDFESFAFFSPTEDVPREGRQGVSCVDYG